MSPARDPSYPLYPVFSFLGFVLCLIPLPWHLHAWNSGTCAFMVWTALLCLVGFVNSVVWSGNVNNPAPIWCDISSKIIVGASIGIPAATLCISRRLYSLTAVQTVSITRDDKRRMVIIDLCLSLGFPILIMILHYIVQGHRFDILEDIGCYPVVYNTLPAYFLYFMWPVVLGVISFVYSSLTLRGFWMRRLQFSQLISSSNSSISMSRYIRLMMLSIIDMMCTVPLGVYTIYIGNKGVSLAPWISWEDTHFNFSRVGVVPSLIWRSDPSFQTSVELTRWLPVLCAFLFFALFGFAAESKKHYMMAFTFVAKPLGFGRPPKVPSKAALPGWVKPLHTAQSTLDSPSQKKVRLDSFTASFADSMELSAYADTDVEKSAGLPSPSSMYSSAPPSYARRHPSHIPEDIDVEAESSYYPSSPSPSTAATFVNTSSPTSPSHPQFLPPSSPPSRSPSLSQPHTNDEPSSKLKRSNGSLRTVTSRDRFYIVAEGGTSRPPSPAPFADMVDSDEERSLSPPLSVYPSFADAIQVTVHTVSRSTEAL